MHTKLFCLIVTTATLSFTPPALAVREATLIDGELKRIPVRFVSLDGDRLTYFDSERRLTTVKSDSKLALRFDRDAKPAPGSEGAAPADVQALHTLRLRDATVVRGRMVGVDNAGRLLWKSPALGDYAADLDAVTSFSVADVAADRPALRATSDDIIELINGDRLTGFVDQITAEKLVLSVEDTPIDLTWDRIARVALANPIKQSPGTWVTLVGGTRVRGDNARLDDSGLAIETADGRQVASPLAGVRAIEFAVARRLAPIDQASYEVTSGGDVFGVPMPPVINGDRVQLHAPVSVTFELPDGANRFATTASLDPADLKWADCVIVIADEKGELARQRLNADTPRVELSVVSRSPGGKLRVTIEPGVNGPVRDRVTLWDTVFLVKSGK